jgi:CheY-like chemotaxis protein
MTVPTNMLWVDDQIGRYQPWIDKFKEFGTSVDSTDSLTDGIRKLDQNRYDVVLLDWKMGHDSCMHALPSISAKSKGANLYVCSSFFYTHELIDQVRQQQKETNIRFGSVDKTNLPFTDDDDATKQFLVDLNASDNLKEAIDTVELNPALGQREDLVEKHEAIPFPSWDEYSDLNARRKIAALREAASITKDVRSRLQKAGFRYLLFCGSWSEPLIMLKTLQNVPSQDEIVEKARANGYAPFVFSVGGGIDDCSENSGLAGYPFLRITFRGTSEEIHFDCGNPYTLLSYEWYVEKGWLSDSFVFELHSAGEMVLYGKHFELPGTMVTDASGETEIVSLHGFAAIDWNATRLATQCNLDCLSWEERKKGSGVCRYRTGLLGRNLAVATGGCLKIDCRSGNTFFDQE